jgi:heterodisulfide reductase subunit A-like polyferredoxin
MNQDMSTSQSMRENPGMVKTSGYRNPVWIATDPYSNRPPFPKLDRNINTDVVIVGGGITGISAAYECVNRGLNTTLIDAREMLSGETGRTSGHLSSALDDKYYELISSKCFSVPALVVGF